MQTKSIGIILVIAGIIMMIYTGINFVTTKNVVDLGPIQINKEVNHPVQWSPIVGGLLILGGIIILVTNNKKRGIV